jgi:hypothetical protein
MPMTASQGDESRFGTVHAHEASDNFKLCDPQGDADTLNADSSCF